tara:strand:- start:692 stop:1573 length:882 start_codon:yes stop_codon:yes gene_type:complete
MQKLHCLDVTLRDGGNRNGFHFTDEDLEYILTRLNHSRIEFVEVGYRNGAIRPIDDIGPAGLCTNAYLEKCNALLPNNHLVVMAHPQNLSSDDITALKQNGVKLLRLCVSRNKADLIKPVITWCHQLGLSVSINFIHASQYQLEELEEVVDKTCQLNPDMIYFADSNGAFLPHQVQNIYERFTSNYKQAFGFHAHDNLGLAQVNAIAAVKAGATYLDFSLAGMGKGIGNLKTEFFSAYLLKTRQKKYELQAILSAANYVRQSYPTDLYGIDFGEFIRGINDLSTAEFQKTLNI